MDAVSTSTQDFCARITATNPAFVTTYRRTRVYAVNGRNKNGRRLRKDRILPAGTRLPIVTSGVATGVLVHGQPYYVARDTEGNCLALLAAQVYLSDHLDDPEPTWLKEMNQLLAAPGDVDPVKINALLVVKEQESTSPIPDFLYHEVPDRGVSKCDYCGWWRNREGQGHMPGCWDPGLQPA